MRIADLLLPELENEVAVTRTVLERVPDDRGEWKPHEKSFAMAHLAQLVSRILSWVPMMLEKTEIDIAPKDGPKTGGYSIEKTETLLAEFDRNAAAARAAIEAASEDAWDVEWTLKAAGNPMQKGSRYQMMRSAVFNHLVHHRAQLGIYLRLVGERVPQMYGPTADDKVPQG